LELFEEADGEKVKTLRIPASVQLFSSNGGKNDQPRSLEGRSRRDSQI
jgi:hypothetical protein